MPTPKEGYWNAAGKRLPSVTTIIGRFKDSEALQKWHFRQGQANPRASNVWEVKRACDIGTCAHGMVQKFIEGKTEVEIELYAASELQDEEMRGQARTAYESYLCWQENFKVQVIEQEVKLISEKYQYGGTPDAIGLVGNNLVLLDWKTSNDTFSDHLLQLAAYIHLWDENRPDTPITGGAHLLRFAKDTGDFHHHHYRNLDMEWEQFLDFRACYERDKAIRKRA